MFKKYVVKNDTGVHCNGAPKNWSWINKQNNNLFVISKNETMKSPIREFKVLQKGQRAFYNPFLKMYYFLFMTLKNILSLAVSFQRL